MGHFETFEKALFAGLLERSTMFPGFEVERCLASISKNCGTDVVISPQRLLAFRSAKAPVGFVIADSLRAWHNPKTVNSALKAFDIKKDYFGTKEVSDLQVLWQLRHTIVHTGAWLTEPDAQKVRRLSKFGGTAVSFDPNFINAVARRLHKIIKQGNARIEPDVITLLGTPAATASVQNLQAFLAVRSPKKVWLQ